MSLDISQFNKPQCEAILHNKGPLLVLAGAGSGKTRVITHRVARLIEDGVPPETILSLTFTNKAAKEMAHRVKAILPDVHPPLISTYHSFCVRVLRNNIHLLDPAYNSKFTILDSDDIRKVVLAAIVKAKVDPDDKIYKPAYIESYIDRNKNNGLLPDKAFDFTFTDIAQKKIYKEYQKILKSTNSVDFGDLLTLSLHLLTGHPEVLASWQKRFHWFQVDEYQDTNQVQYDIIRLLSGHTRNLLVVGDDAQAIYSFRGSDLGIILGFEKDFPDAKVIKLEQNYRCGQSILKAANAVIAVNVNKKEKLLFTENRHDHKITIAELKDGDEESRYLIDTIRKARSNGVPYKDIAIMYRMNALSRSAEEALLRAGIPYVVVGGMSYYDRKEVKDIIAYLRVLANKDDDMALCRIINVPTRGIGKQAIEKLATAAGDADISLLEALFAAGRSGAKGTGKLADFAKIMRRLQMMVDTMPLSDFIKQVIALTGYEKSLVDEKTEVSASRLENVKELMTVASFYKAGGSEVGDVPPLTAFLEKIALLSSLDKDDSGNTVTLLSLHASKGLEFPICFILGLEEGIFPHARSMSNADDLEEERRICYVGITRAKERLHLLTLNYRTMFGKGDYTTPSRFLDEIPRDCVAYH